MKRLIFLLVLIAAPTPTPTIAQDVPDAPTLASSQPYGRISREERKLRMAQRKLERQTARRLRFMAWFSRDKDARTLCQFCLQDQDAFDQVVEDLQREMGYGDIGDGEWLDKLLEFIQNVDWEKLMQIIINAIQAIFDIFSGTDNAPPAEVLQALESMQNKLSIHCHGPPLWLAA